MSLNLKHTLTKWVNTGIDMHLPSREIARIRALNLVALSIIPLIILNAIYVPLVKHSFPQASLIWAIVALGILAATRYHLFTFAKLILIFFSLLALIGINLFYGYSQMIAPLYSLLAIGSGYFFYRRLTKFFLLSAILLTYLAVSYYLNTYGPIAPKSPGLGSYLYFIFSSFGIYLVIHDLLKFEQNQEEMIQGQEEVLENQKEEIQEHIATIQAVLDGSQDEILVLNSTGGVIMCNAVAQTVYKQKYNLNLSLDTCLCTELPEAVRYLYYQSYYKALNGENIRIEVALPSLEGGAPAYKDISFNPVRSSKGQIIGALSISRDISELKQKELTLKAQNEELEKYIESNLQLENFAYLASHDLQAPLQNILGFSELLETNLNGRLNPQESKMLTYIGSTATQMNSLVEDLLEFSRANAECLHIARIHIPSFLDTIITDLTPYMEEKEAQIDLDSLPEYVEADPMKLRQVFLNLISNALKFSSTEKTPQILISANETPHSFLFSIQDNGIGIPRKAQTEIFKLFNRLHPQNQYRGSGLGLALCKNLIEKHNGSINVRSEEGKGSTFTFSLPKDLGNLAA